MQHEGDGVPSRHRTFTVAITSTEPGVMVKRLPAGTSTDATMPIASAPSPTRSCRLIITSSRAGDDTDTSWSSAPPVLLIVKNAAVRSLSA